ncbi:MAG TPA: hypothetical protein VHW65_13190 [Gemmatimonadales bacterium]|jgi:hypothetical protein|nr:hypothetical protein [Gemmatimonadales bacterium]
MQLRAFVLVAIVATAAACSGNQLPEADIDNVIDTVTMGALNGAALELPSAFDATTGFAVRTDQTSSFDFVYEIDSTGRHVILPLQAIGLPVASGTNPGLQIINQTFSAFVNPPTDGYSTTDTLEIHVGDVVAVRSRAACYLGVPQYAKVHVLSFNDSLRSATMEAMSDTNCGYRSLAPGIPTS